MKQHIILLTTLLGLILPFGNIWGPFLIRCDDDQQKSFRRTIVLCETGITFLLFVGSTIIWIWEIRRLVDYNHGIDSTPLLYLAVSYALAILSFAALGSVHLYFSRKNQ